MRKIYAILSVLLLASLVLAACQPAQTTEQATASPAVTEGAVEITPEAPAATPTDRIVVVTNTPAATEEMAETSTPAGTPTPEATQVTSDMLPITGLSGLTISSELMDVPVVDSAGVQVGVIKELAIDLDEENIAYVIVLPNGSDEDSDDYIPVPWGAMTFSGGAPALAVDQETFATAHNFDLRAAPALIETDWDEEFLVVWEELLPELAPAAPEGEAAEEPAAEETEAASDGMEGIVLSDQILEVPVAASASEMIGAIQELVINLDTGAVPFVLAAPEAGTGMDSSAAGTPVATAAVTAEATAAATAEATAAATPGASGSEGLSSGAELIPIPFSALARDLAAGVFTLEVSGVDLGNAPRVNLAELDEETLAALEDQVMEFWPAVPAP